MKRSTGKTIQINPRDFLLAKEGKKTCTSRYGNRLQDYKIGEVYDFCNNENDDIIQIRITNWRLTTLKDVSSEEAYAIGNYSWADHVADFYKIYHEKLGRDVNENTVVTLIHFETVK